jgi:hypothetical protein
MANEAKEDIKTRAIKKWKAWLNIDGSKLRYGTHYDETLLLWQDGIIYVCCYQWPQFMDGILRKLPMYYSTPLECILSM